MNVPNHIAIILDGNGRWAKERGMPRTYGHVKGCANLENICYDIKDLGVKYLTVYAFSTENWKRSREEVEALMKLFRSYLKKCIKISKKNNMRMKVIGDITAFAPDIQQSVRELEEYSKDFDGIYFQLALNYGSRDEIRRAVTKIVEEGIRPEELPREGNRSCRLPGQHSTDSSCSRFRKQFRPEYPLPDSYPHPVPGMYRQAGYGTDR